MYEYKVISLTEGSIIEECINKPAKEGWRLVAVQDYYYYFERKRKIQGFHDVEEFYGEKKIE